MMGLCPVPVYDRFQTLGAFEKSPVLLRIGDRIKFVPVETEEFDFARQQVWECAYKFSIKEGIYKL